MEGDFGSLSLHVALSICRLYSRISGSVNLEFALWCLLKRCLASNSEVPAEIPPSPPLGKGGTTTKGGVDGYYEREGGVGAHYRVTGWFCRALSRALLRALPVTSLSKRPSSSCSACGVSTRISIRRLALCRGSSGRARVRSAMAATCRTRDTGVPPISRTLRAINARSPDSSQLL